MKIERYVEFLPDIDTRPTVRSMAATVRERAIEREEKLEVEKAARRALFLRVRKIWTREQIKEAVAKGVAIEAERKKNAV